MSRDTGNKNERLRILLADRTPMASNLLAEMLGRKPHFHVVAAVVPTEVLTAVNKLRPEIIVLSADADHGSARGIEVAGELLVRFPEVRTIILVDSCDRDLVVAAFVAGARGIFSRTEPLANFCKCIERVHQSQIWADNRQINFLLEALMRTVPYRVVDGRGNELLTGRELEVVQLAARGYTNFEIAGKMGLSEHTVKNYMFRSFDKLGVSNRVEMLFYVLSHSGPGQKWPSSSAPSASMASISELQDAANAGSISAQVELATKYRHGSGVERDMVEAHFWLRAAEEQATEIAERSRTARRRLASRISPAESETIEVRVTEWLNAHRKKPANAVDTSKRIVA